MPMHDDHRRSDDAHLLSLRLALGTILSPKRPQTTPSSSTSGTASPAVNCPHSAIPLTPTHSNSSSHPAPTPNLAVVHPQHAHHHHHHHHHHHYHHPLRPDHHQPAMPCAAEGAPLHTDDPHPHIPDAVAPLTHEGAGPIGVAVPMPGNMTPGARARFVETLQSKSKSWDALIHGSWV
ncbi:hypothetical protein LXA43DRAFT_42843 [Ganoderma leucocontextum]|nr:hypothetical protein LXA43DRAFT_42843 [Ganoderma leucocontextum]